MSRRGAAAVPIVQPPTGTTHGRIAMTNMADMIGTPAMAGATNMDGPMTITASMTITARMTITTTQEIEPSVPIEPHHRFQLGRSRSDQLDCQI